MKSIQLQHLFFCLLFGASIFPSFGQTVAEKKLQGGLTGSVGFNYLNMGTSLLEAQPGLSTSVGVNFIKATKESQNIAFLGGVEFNLERFNYKVTGQDVFYRYTDQAIKMKSETIAADKYYRLTERTYKPLYLGLPIGMAFRTDFIGDYRGVVKFGLQNRFLLSNTVDDIGFSSTTPSEIGDYQENVGMSAKKDLFFYNAGLFINLGAEWNFSGSTCLLIELGYQYGFMPLHLTSKEQNYTLFTVDNLGAPTYFRNQAIMNQANLKFTLLF
ncbi:MAG: hypothetical protein ACKOBN_08140 [Flavobacteriales bacterium]